MSEEKQKLLKDNALTDEIRAILDGKKQGNWFFDCHNEDRNTKEVHTSTGCREMCEGFCYEFDKLVSQVQELCESHAAQQTAEKDKEIAELKKESKQRYDGWTQSLNLHKEREAEFKKQLAESQKEVETKEKMLRDVAPGFSAFLWNKGCVTHGKVDYSKMLIYLHEFEKECLKR